MTPYDTVEHSQNADRKRSNEMVVLNDLAELARKIVE